jgi:hypothetical protein
VKFARRITAALLAGGMISTAQFGYGESAPIVQWTGVLDVAASALDLSATVQEGWHVYAATQLPGGPTPLQVTLGEGAGARLQGVASGTVPLKRHDTSFDLDTEFYTKAFTVHLPVVWHASRDTLAFLPVVVRYQTCSDRECLPPKTIQLSVPTSGAVKM